MVLLSLFADSTTFAARAAVLLTAAFEQVAAAFVDGGATVLIAGSTIFAARASV